MDRYDREQGFRGGYDEGGFGERWGGGYRGAGEGSRRWYEPRFARPAPYDAPYGRDIYGEGYPGFGGAPGGRFRGMYYGGSYPGGYGSPYAGGYGSRYGGEYSGRGPFRPSRDAWSSVDRDRGGYGWRPEAGGGRGGPYDSAYADAPFMPEEAYSRHPEYDRPQRHVEDRWPDRESGMRGGFEPMDDDEILQAVRQSLFQDNWVDAERIQVQVERGIVTLSGDVDDFLEARYAWDDAWETHGVRGVINHIHVHVEGPAGEHDTVVQGGTGKAKGKRPGSS